MAATERVGGGGGTNSSNNTTTTSSSVKPVEQQFCLRWNNFQSNIAAQFGALRAGEDFCDVTLACGGVRLPAHRLVLSACSPYFKDLFQNNPCAHPIIFMRDCEVLHIAALLEFMYAGEVNIAQSQLTAFLRTAEALQIRGLTDSSERNRNENKNVTKPNSQLRNLLCGRLRQPNSPAKEISQNDISEEMYKRTVQQLNQSQKNVCTDSDDPMSGSHNGITENNFPNTKTRSNKNFDPKGDSLKYNENILLTNKDGDNIIFNSTDNQLLLNESDNTSLSKINPFAVGSVAYGGLNSDFSNDMIEPKIEVPDYTSEDESRQDQVYHSDIFVAEGVAQVNQFSSQSDIAGTSQDMKGDIEGPSQLESTESGTSNAWIDLQQLQSKRYTIKNDPSQKLIKLGEGIELLEEQIRSVKWADYRKLTRSLAALLFSPAELATCSVTGQRWSRAGLEERPTKPPLDRRKVQAIISYVSRRFPLIEVSRIKQVLAYKCKENCTAFRMKSVSEAGLPQSNAANNASRP